MPEEEKKNGNGCNGCPGKDSGWEAAPQEGKGCPLGDVSPEDRELLEHILYFMAHKKPAR